MATIKVEFTTEDWVWLCEVLADIRAYDDEQFVTLEDKERCMSALESLENGR